LIDPTSKDFRFKHRQVDFRDRELELKLVAGVVKSKKIMEKMYLVTDSNIITSDKIKWIYDKAVALYLEHGVAMDKKAFENLLDVFHKKRKSLLSLWKKIQAMSKEVSLASTIAAGVKLTQYFDGRNMELGVKDMIELLTKAWKGGDLKSIAQAREELMVLSGYMDTRDLKADVGDPRDGYEDYKREFKKIQKNPKLIRGVSTGIAEIDKSLIGLREGELGLVAGPTGSGKSIMGMDFLTYCWQTTGDVVALTIEMSKEQYRQRWYCRLSGINYENFRRYDLTPKQWKHLDRTIAKAAKNPNKFIIIDMPEGCTVEAAKGEFKTVMRTADIKLGVIDYMNIMAGPKGEIDMTWETQLGLAAALKLKLARVLGIPLWSMLQTTDDKGKVAFSTHIKDQADVGLRIKPDENTPETGIVGMDWFKTRDFKARSFSLQTDLDKMRFSPVPLGQRHKYKQINKRKKKRLKT